MNKNYAKRQLKVYERKLQLIDKLFQDINDMGRINKLIEKGFYSSINKAFTAWAHGTVSWYWFRLKLQYEDKINYYKEKLS